MSKNHQMVNGKLLQTNKQWSALKQKQKEWITETARQAHSKAVQENGKPVNKTGKLEIIDAVYEQIEAREIWIPYRQWCRNRDFRADGALPPAHRISVSGWLQQKSLRPGTNAGHHDENPASSPYRSEGAAGPFIVIESSAFIHFIAGDFKTFPNGAAH